MKNSKIILLATFLSMVGARVLAHDIAVANADGVTIYYVWANNNTELSVRYRGTSYSSYSEYSGNVVIPESVTYNGTTYPVTSIGNEAFNTCSGLTSVTIPNSVTSIGNAAFYGCSGLTSITIPNSVTSIGVNAFSGTAWYNNQPDGLVYAGKVAYRYKGTMPQNTNISLIEGTLVIADYAFSGRSGLTSVTIPNSVTSIGDEAFYNCSGLTSVIIPNSVTSIGDYAFYNTRLKSVTIGTGVLSIGNSAFSYSTTSYGDRPIKVIWLTNTPPSGYSNAAGTVNYVANNLYTSLNNKTVYPFLSSIFEVDGVKYVPVSPSERTCDAIDCLYDSNAENINIGKTVSYKGIEMAVQRVHKYACYDNSFIQNVNLSLNGDVEYYAFYGCKNISRVMAVNVGNIGANAFQNCTAMTTATLDEEVTSIGNYAFDGCSSLESIVIPNAVINLGQYAFQNCSKMNSVKIGTGVETISQYTFSGCSSLTDMQIGSNVKTINQYAFNGCKALPKIQIPLSVTSIGNDVFRGCTGLKTVIMDEQESELKLGYNYYSSSNIKPLFSDCPLDSVYIGRNISYSTESKYGYSPFYRNTSLRSVHITDRETEISPNEFYGCTNLKNVRIGNGVTKIGDWAFSGCSSLDFFSFGSSVTTIGKEAFSDCTAMTKLISHATTPPTCGSQALDDINKWSCTLSVPSGYTSVYQQAEQWKEFFFVVDDNGDSVDPGSKKCAKPTIGYRQGKLTFSSETEGVEFLSNITDSDIRSYSSSEVQLSVTYNISVYATKSGYENSDVATATLCWIDVEPRTEGITNDIANIPANAVLIQSDNGQISVSGVADNTRVSVFGTDGLQAGSAVSHNGTANIQTRLQSGSVAIVRIGEKSVKVVVR